MSRQLTVIATSLSIATVGICTASAAPIHHRPTANPGTVIPKLTGSIDPHNASWFLSQVANRTDQIVGLQIYIEPSTDEDLRERSYYVSNTSEPFSLSKGPAGEIGGGVEMVAPRAEVTWQHGGWIIDGFYLVKSGGVHQGAVSVGLEKVSEASVILSSKFRVVVKSIPSK